METNGHFKPRHCMPLRSLFPTHGGVAFCRSLLLVLLTAMTQIAFAGQPIGTTSDTGQFKMTKASTSISSGDLLYTFDLLIFNYDGNNYRWKDDVWLTLDGQSVVNLSQICRDNHCAYTIGDSSEDNARKWTETEGDFAGSATATLNGFTNVTVGLYNPYYEVVNNKASRAIWVTVKVGIERTWYNHNYTLGVCGTWRTINGKEVWRHPSTQLTATANFTWPSTDVSEASFTRSANRTVTFTTTFPTLQMNGANWEGRVQLLKDKPSSTSPYVSATNRSAHWNGEDWTGTNTLTKTFTVTSNYDPVTIYPRLERFLGNNYEKDNLSYEPKYDRDYNKVVIGGFPKAVINNVTTNPWDKSVTLTWTEQKPNPLNSKVSEGQWGVYRKTADGAITKVGTVGYSSTKKFTDTSVPDMDVNYTYMVSYIPSGQDWSEAAEEAPIPDLYSEKTDVKVKALDNYLSMGAVTADDTEAKITVNWSISEPIGNDSQLEFTLYHSTDEGSNKTWSSIATVSASKSTGTEYSHTHNLNSEPNTCAPHFYKVTITAMGKEYSIETTGGVSSKAQSGIIVGTLYATKGMFSNVVKLNWDAKQVGSTPIIYNIYRRKLGTNGNFALIGTLSDTNTTYSYDDNTAAPGDYYEYQVESVSKCEVTKNGHTYNNDSRTSDTDDGFCVAAGVVSGTVAYGSNTAVQGVKVSLIRISDSNALNNDQYHSASIDYASQNTDKISSRSSIVVPLTADQGEDLFTDKPWTIQMYVRIDELGNNGAYLVYGYNSLSLQAKKSNNGGYHLWMGYPDSDSSIATVEVDNKTLQYGRFYSVAYSYDKIDKTYSVRIMDVVNGKDTLTVSNKKATNSSHWVHENSSKPTPLVFGDAYNVSAPTNATTTTTSYGWKGNIDDIRVFSGRKLTDDEIKKNYNHVLAGNEKDLAIYYPLDEGIENQKTAYDMSKTGGVSNGHHGKFVGMAKSSAVVPDDNQLALFNYTDAQGNYTVSGIPFSGEGISYMVTPTMGIHEFEPNYATRFISANSLIHSGVNFKDVSSFKVSGQVLYKNTTIPVEDVMLYVDGLVASRNGSAVKTDSEGKFEMDVPIGDHYISVALNGHEFENEGRYPADSTGIGKKYTFKENMTNLTFYDVTTVVVAGRVAGGDIEYNKPLGFGAGNANIGKATITLKPTEAGKLNVKPQVVGTTVEYVARGKDLRYDSLQVTDKVPSEAYIANGDQFFTVKTNPESGEFVVKLPPLNYRVESVTLDNYPTADKMPAALSHIPVPVFDNLPMIDATKAQVENTDSMMTADSTYIYFKYVGAAKIEYKTQSALDVVENEDGSFGEKSVKVNVLRNGKEVKIPFNVYDKTTGQYTFGHPIYQQMESYTYKLYGYERYYNFDENPNAPVSSDVPLANADVTIKNQYSSTTGIWIGENKQIDENPELKEEDNTFQLDSLGRGTYRFVADIPNVVSPYTRNISISYSDGKEKNITWSHPVLSDGVIVLGSLPTGNDFITKGPTELLMVLRDPPGSNSSATYSKGTTTIKERQVTVEPHSYFEFLTTEHLGFSQETQKALDPTFSFQIINEIENRFNLDTGVQINASFSNNHTWTTTTTTTEEISTSDDPDFVGADGDVFVGMSKNMIFGAVRLLHVVEDGGEMELKAENAVSMGEEFDTHFFLAQKQIIEETIPNLEEVRDALLTHVTPEQLASTNTTDGKDPLYLTIYEPGDPEYGTSNSDTIFWKEKAVPFIENKNQRIYDGPSYKAIFPEDYSGLDEVNYYNEQIKTWKKRLADNEEAKVKAWNSRDQYLDRNYSLDAGASVTLTHEETNVDTHTNSESQEVNCIFGGHMGLLWQKVGVTINVSETIGITTSEEQTDGTEETTVTSYTLAESGSDYFTVDVFDAPDNFGPIFRTRAGATSCPYEDEVVTKYYKPGTVIMEKTVQVEIPEINNQTELINGIPAGHDAVFKVDLRNLSNTGEDAYFNLYVDDKSNPDGAALYMDGYNITNGRRILVPANETLTKTFTLRQTNPDVLEYKNIRICLSSECQDDIVDETTVSVNFTAACSDIVLKASTTLVNTETTAPLILSLSGYNTNMASLTGALLQYKGANDADWITLQEYTTDPDKVDESKKLLKTLSGAQTLDYSLDMKTTLFTDQVYEFRAITNCVQGSEVVHSESDWVEVVRDITRPQLLATPTPSSGVLGIGDDISILFNEDIRSSSLRSLDNFFIRGAMNESEVAHDVALSLSGDKTVKTDATINLSGKSFATNLWLNYSTDGTLLQHGVTGNNFTVAIEDGKLAVTVGGEKKESSLTLPPNKWIFLALSYDNSGETPKLNAGYAQNADTYDLMKNVEVPAYNGNGPVAVGGGNLTAKVQELALWNNANSLDEALASRFTTKSQFTNGLMGYWQFNEGHGSVAADRARQRSMTLPSDNGWFLDGVNYALTLDGSSVAAADISTINTLASDDYLIEAWFRADAGQTGTASVMSIGNDRLDLRLNTDGQLELSTVSGAANATNTAMVSNDDLRDGQWHHVALNVLKSTNGNSTVYLDGKARTQVKASLTPALQGDKLFLGGHRTTGDGTTYGQFLKGAIDEVRIWKGRRTGDVITSMMYNRVQGDEPGLVAYYPLETSTLDEGMQDITIGYAANCATDLISAAVGPMVVFQNDNGNGHTVEPAYSTESTPALAVAPKQENVMFNFVANERQITINLLEEPYKIEGCTIYMTAKDVKDLNGNAADNVTWSVYVQQKRLKWAEDEVSVVKHGNEETAFSVGIENISGVNETFEITDLPMWLSVDNISGKLSPLSKRTLTFSVAPSLAIGSYDATVYLKGAQDIPTPLSISLTVEGDRPNWVATTGPNTMTIIGKLKIENELSNDPNDMVAAFNGTVCVGVAQPEYYSEDDTYFVLLNVFGEGAADIVYKAYDASTGQVYPSITISNVDESLQPNRFVADKVIGSFGDAAIFLPNNEVEQDLSSDHAGWKWFSLYAQPKNADIDQVFKNAGQAVSSILNPSGASTNSADGWFPTIELNYSTMYKIKIEEPFAETVIGAPANSATTITLNPNWSWIGYPLQASNSLLAAFADTPQDGDIVKGQSAFAMYYEGDWVGTLQAMTPGEGYMYQSTADHTKTFTYQTPAHNSRRMEAPARKSSATDGNIIATHKDNMTMIAVVMNDDEQVEDAQVSVYDGTELCALSTEAVSEGRHFLTIGGTAGQPDALTFVVTTEEGTFALPTAMTFQANAHYGTMAQPYVLQLAEATGIDMAQGGAAIKSIQLFDGSGRMVRSTERPARLYTKNDLKSLPAGVYYQQVTFSNGQTIVQKIMR